MKVKNLTGCKLPKVTRAARIRKELQLVKHWELVIAKCHAGTTPLQVTEFHESKNLTGCEKRIAKSHSCCTSS